VLRIKIALTIQVHNQGFPLNFPLDELKQQLVVPGRPRSNVLVLADSIELHIKTNITDFFNRVVLRG
jgi:hypothetical protein